MTRLRIASAESLWPGEMCGVAVAPEGRRVLQVLLLNLDGVFYAYEDRCAHLGAALSHGRLEGGMLTCPVHAWQYDARSGVGINPAGVRLRSIPVRTEGDDVFMELDDG